MPIITLLTDFGTTDYFVGAMKGAILAVNSQTTIVDITHETEPHNVRSAAFTLFAAAQTFPENTIHIAVVDPGVGSNRRAILAVCDRGFFIAPDNGLLEFVFQNVGNLRVFHLTNDKYFRRPVSQTFHGRDVFAPIAGWLSNGISPAELGAEITDFVRLEITKPQQISENTIETEILHIDRFGNCLVNLTHADLPADFANNLRLEINNQKIDKLQNYFAEAAIGEIFMIFGSANLLEIVAYQTSAAKLLKIKVGDKILVKQTVDLT